MLFLFPRTLRKLKYFFPIYTILKGKISLTEKKQNRILIQQHLLNFYPCVEFLLNHSV